MPAIKLLLLSLLLLSPLSMASTSYQHEPDEEMQVTQQVDEILVKKSQRKMFLLSEGKVLREYPVSLGKESNNPQAETLTNITPEGNFVVSDKTPDQQFHKAFHLASSAEKQNSPLMIHGLPSHYKYDENFLLEFDWTNGGIAVSTKALDELWSLVKRGTPIAIQP